MNINDKSSFFSFIDDWKDLGLEEAEEANNGPKDIALFCSSVSIVFNMKYIVTTSSYY